MQSKQQQARIEYLKQQWRRNHKKAAAAEFERFVSELLVDVQMNEWKPIDSAPRDGSDILVYYADTEEQRVASWRKRSRIWQFAYFAVDDVFAVCHPSHWMELPEPPK